MKVRRKHREKRTHAVKWFLIVTALSFCVLGYGAFQGLIHMTNDWLKDLPSVADTNFVNSNKESVVYAADGKTKLAQFQLEKRQSITLEQTNDYIINATVDTEDARFYDHNGVDPIGIVRAAINNFTGGSQQGASTITQQLVRNTILSDEANEGTLKRKLREANLALEMEKLYSKDEILMMYLNTINYGDGCYGIQAAAQNYFSVDAADLTLAQAATLAGIPQSPTNLNPKENPDGCLDRRNLVLSRMYASDDITKEEYEAAKAEELNLNPSAEAPSDGILAYPYFTSYVRNLLLDEDSGFGISYADLFSGGLVIYTTLDPTIQECAEQACAEQYENWGDTNLEAALVATDPETGRILSMIGGRDYNTEEWNIATQGGRPTGSTFKVITLATAIEQGISPNALLDCTNPLKTDDGQEINNINETNQGIQTVAKATAISSNTGYYRLAQEVTPYKMINMASRLGLNDELPSYPIITLGTENETPLAMANAYAVFANGGIYHDTYAVSQILDKDGNVLYEAEEDDGEQVISEEVAGAVTDTLRCVFTDSDGTAYGCAPANGQDVAGKTGTGVEFRDHWLVGYSPQISCAVWVGDRNYESTDESVTANYLWSNFMSAALENYDTESFQDYEEPLYENDYNQQQLTILGSKVKMRASGIPDVTGMTLKQARFQLYDYCVVVEEARNDSIPEGCVINQQADSIEGAIKLTVCNPNAQTEAKETGIITKPKPSSKDKDKDKDKKDAKSSDANDGKDDAQSDKDAKQDDEEKR